METLASITKHTYFCVVYIHQFLMNILCESNVYSRVTSTWVHFYGNDWPKKRGTKMQKKPEQFPCIFILARSNLCHETILKVSDDRTEWEEIEIQLNFLLINGIASNVSNKLPMHWRCISFLPAGTVFGKFYWLENWPVSWSMTLHLQWLTFAAMHCKSCSLDRMKACGTFQRN